MCSSLLIAFIYLRKLPTSIISFHNTCNDKDGADYVLFLFLKNILYIIGRQNMMIFAHCGTQRGEGGQRADLKKK